jgi:hypothetical protein
MLKLQINNRNSPSYYQMPLLFLNTRSTGLTKGCILTIGTLYSTLDCIPLNIESISVTPATALVLPLNIIFPLSNIE